MGKVKRQDNHAIKKILMKEKSLAMKKKREAESYHESPEPNTTKQATKDYAAVLFRKAQVTQAAPMHTAHFLSYNTALGPPYRIWLDTNFINFSMQNKLDIVQSLMDCLLAKVIPCICDCVFAELEKLGKKFRIALKLARDKRFERLTCDSKYADDCVVRTVTQHPIYIVATCDQELKRRLRKVPGVPIMYISKHRYTIERLPEAYGAPA
ncbi:putative PIN like domain/Fcf1 [Leishmania utingensis]|uniref:PIN like domain/Fcf1 n=1 Tax=Leishmania utingensis TaxID=653362 RepID=A0AAW3ANL1_9TRYP